MGKLLIATRAISFLHNTSTKYIFYMIWLKVNIKLAMLQYLHYFLKDNITIWVFFVQASVELAVFMAVASSSGIVNAT